MTEINFESDIFYSQLAVFQYGLKNPFNDWNDIHINQGFALRGDLYVMVLFPMIQNVKLL